MKEIILKISQEDFDKIEKKLVFEGNTENLRLDVVEAEFKESPQFQLIYIKGELK